MFLKPKTQSDTKLKCERTQRSQKTSFHSKHIPTTGIYFGRTKQIMDYKLVLFILTPTLIF